FSSRRRHTRLQGDWSSDVCSSDLTAFLQQHVAKIVERTARRDTRFQLANRTGGKVPGIRKRSKPLLLAFRIQLLEGADRHEKFAANFEIQRHACLLERLFRNRQGDR